jgi:tripartite-type tricarboxylate transporter receptor subunit TctC
MAGSLDLMFDNLPSALPEVPTVSEAGGLLLNNHEANSWFGLLTPAGTPPDIVNRIQQETTKALSSPVIKERMLSQGAIRSGNTPVECAKLIADETKQRAQAVKASGAKVD